MQFAAGAQVSFAPQKLELQSASEKHFCPTAHFGHFEPPQSISVSSPFFVMSEQVGLAIPDELLDELLATPLDELLWPELELWLELELAELLSAQLPAPPSPVDVFKSGAQAAKSAEVTNAPKVTCNPRALSMILISYNDKLSQ